MKQSKLSKLENNYYYGISRYFWHIVIGISILAIIIGVFVSIWSKIPPSKQKVVKSEKPIKPSYPAEKGVSLESLINALPTIKKTPIKQEVNTTVIYEDNREPVVESAPTKTVDSFALNAFERELGETKNLISITNNKAFWNGTGVWRFETERDRKMFKKTGNYKYAKKWFPIKDGFKSKFLYYTQNIEDYNQKTKILASLNTCINGLYNGNRKLLLNKVVSSAPIKYNNTANKFIQINNGISNILSKIDSTKQLKNYAVFYRFVANNPNDGLPLISYISSIIDNVYLKQRDAFANNIIMEYSSRYNNNLHLLKNAVNQFVPYLKQISPELQAKSLPIFFKLYRKNNAQRTNEIKQIDREYRNVITNWENNFQEQLQAAELSYQTKKTAKKELFKKSYQGIGVGFVVVLVLSLFLLILSMVRNVNRLSEAILENNQLLAKGNLTIKNEDVINQ